MAEKLKVLILNGSPRTEGNTTIAIHEMEHVFEENGVEYETIQVGKMDIRGCAACGTCYKNGKCMFDDIVSLHRNSRLQTVWLLQVLSFMHLQMRR